MKFEATPDRTLVRTRGNSRRYVRVRIEAPAAPGARRRPAANLAVVIDRSGSMQGEKIERARDAALQAVRTLGDSDRLAVVAYDHEIDVVLPSTEVNARSRGEAELAISDLYARGTTNLCEGWMRGCEQVGEYLDGEQIGRALLMSDGLANQGITDRGEIARHAAALRARGVATSTFGIGHDFDETLLAGMAEAGGGNFYYIESAAQIPDFVASEIGESLDVVVRDAAIVVDAPPGVRVLSPNGYEVSGDDRGRWRVRLGALVSRQHLEPIVELRFPRGEREERAAVELRLEDAGRALDTAPIALEWCYAGDRDNDRQPRDVEVDRSVARMYAAATRREALRLNEVGKLDAASAAMLDCASLIECYAGDDAELCETLDAVRSDAVRYAKPLRVGMRKSAHADAMYSMKMRSPRGRSVRTTGRDGVVLLPLLAETCALADSVVDDAGPQLGRLLGRIEVRDDLMALDRHDEHVAADLDAGEESRLVRAALERAGGAAVRIVTTRRHLADNWFSHWHEDASTAISSLFAWSETAAVSPRAFVAYELLLHGLHALSPRYDALDLAHDETRGCLFDFCRLRPEIEIKLQTMDLCPSCEASLLQLGIRPERLRAACEAVRVLAEPVGRAEAPDNRREQPPAM